MSQKLKLFSFLIIFLFLPFFVSADSLYQKVSFSIDSSYDFSKRAVLTATLQKISNQLYFYIDDDWWNNLKADEKTKIFDALNNLTGEFENKIYPNLVLYFGQEWKPGIDNDTRITILIHPMVEEAGGYFNSGDEYPKLQSPKSNQREMIYLNSLFIDKAIVKSLLAHEFFHLINFNQKDKTYGLSEEIWLNEARAEYIPTFLGYDDVYEGSNLEKRVKIFLEKPNDSLTEWKGKKEDYGIINLFSQYLVNQYGVKILTDSLFSNKVGIPSLNDALKKRGVGKDFSQIFSDWAIAVLVNDCSLAERYCYKNPNLKNLKVVPQLNLLPLIGESSLQVTNASPDWSANWYKIIGGKGKLTLEFDGQDEGKFLLPYLLCDSQEKCQIYNLLLDGNQKGNVSLPELNKNNQSLVIIPLPQTRISGFDGTQPTYLFTWKVSAVEKTEEERVAELLAQIEFLKKEIARVQAQIAAILGGQKQIACGKFEKDLYFGMRENAEVSCLQEFLKSQGETIYPEGLVSGNFLSLTQAAVIRFQEKYSNEILSPLGLTKGTGFVGSATRTKINQILGK